MESSLFSILNTFPSHPDSHRKIFSVFGIYLKMGDPQRGKQDRNYIKILTSGIITSKQINSDF